MRAQMRVIFPREARMEQATVELHDLAQSTVQAALSSADAAAGPVQAALRDLQRACHRTVNGNDAVPF